MVLYVFTNRRRAKDAIMLLVDKYDVDGISVFVQDEIVLVKFDGSISQDEINIIMHYAQPINSSVYDISLDSITELYRGSGLVKFRV